MVKVLGHRTLYRDPRFHAAFPSVIRFDDGRLLLAFRRAAVARSTRSGAWTTSTAARTFS